MSEQLLGQFSEEDNEPIPPPSRWVRIGRVGFVIVAILGLLYLSGGYQYFFLHRTPAGAEQTVLESKVQEEQITVPVIVHVLTGTPGSERTENDARRLVTQANRIWNQANISFSVEEIFYHPVTNDELRTFHRDPHLFITQTETYDPRFANLYLTRTLDGVNGLAYGGTNAIAVADFTSNLDYRTLAHEFGHLLSLPHASSHKQLMSSGATGTEISLEEIETARNYATTLGLFPTAP